MQETAARETNCETEAATDAALLTDFARRGREEAFNELTRRHAGFVYASALRQVRDPATAHDITQAVFIALARKAGSLTNETVLSGWLFRSVRYLVLDLHRRAARRTSRENEAAPMLYEKDSADSEELSQRFEGHLDAALAALGNADRKAVLLRFFDRKPWAEVGVLLGSNENAARVRVNRAVTKMRAFFEKRGVLVNLESLAHLLENTRASESIDLGTLRSPTPKAEGLAELLLRRSRSKPIAWAAAMLSLVGISLLLLLNRSAEPTIDSLRVAGGALVTSIDRTFTASDAPGFLATIIFRSADEPFRPVLRDYLAAAGEFREAMQEKFKSRDAWGATFRPLFSPDLKTRPEQLSTDFILFHATPDYIFIERRIRREWRWDFFAQIPNGEREHWRRRLTQQAARFREAAAKVRSDSGADEGTILNGVSSPQ
jgi:RNA polymerase sigma factor (sigma-70 family)